MRSSLDLLIHNFSCFEKNPTFPCTQKRENGMFEIMICCTATELCRDLHIKIFCGSDDCWIMNVPDRWYMYLLCCRNLFHTTGGWWTLGECLQKRTTHQWQPLQDHRRGERARKRQQGPRGRSGPAERNGQRNQRVHGGHQRRRLEKCHQADLINSQSFPILTIFTHFYYFYFVFYNWQSFITEQVIYTRDAV